MTMQKHERHSEKTPSAPQARGDGAKSKQQDSAASAASSIDQAPQPEHIEVSEQAADLVRLLQMERDEAVDGRLRALADFRNYQRRASESEQRALTSGAAKVVRAMLPALDHFDLALNQRADQMNLKQLMAAVSIVRDEFNKALLAQGVERIAPAKGEPFDPNRHEAVMRQADPEAAPNSVVTTLQAGYSMGDVVLRPAKVAVAPGDDG